MDSATERLLEYAGKRRNQVSNPCLTANQAIAVANDIQSLQRERDALREALQKLSFECSDDLSGPAKRYIDELLAQGAPHER